MRDAMRGWRNAKASAPSNAPPTKRSFGSPFEHRRTPDPTKVEQRSLATSLKKEAHSSSPLQLAELPDSVYKMASSATRRLIVGENTADPWDNAIMVSNRMRFLRSATMLGLLPIVHQHLRRQSQIIGDMASHKRALAATELEPVSTVGYVHTQLWDTKLLL